MDFIQLKIITKKKLKLPQKYFLKSFAPCKMLARLLMLKEEREADGVNKMEVVSIEYFGKKSNGR